MRTPGVVRLSETAFHRKTYLEASALRSLLERAFTTFSAESDGIDDRRPKQMTMYLRLARQRSPLMEITRQSGVHNRSYIHQ